MRITTGIIGGRTIRVPKGIRPTQDMVRQALFNSLGERIVDARVLELFAGSGALGLEAWSRGAASVTWVEQDPAVVSGLKRNIDELCKGAAGLSVVRSDALKYLEHFTGEAFDLILADPPYDKTGENAWLGKTLIALEQRPILALNGILAFEQGASEALPDRPDWNILREKRYGETRLLLLARSAKEVS